MILVMFVPFELHTKFGLMDAEPVKSSKHESHCYAGSDCFDLQNAYLGWRRHCSTNEYVMCAMKLMDHRLSQPHRTVMDN